MTRRKLPAPRWQTPLPEGVVGSWGPDVIAYASTVLGIELDRWQRRVLNRALAYGADGRLVHRLYLASTPRQNGKTALVRSLVGWALTNRSGPEWSAIFGIANDRRQAGIPYRAVLADLGPLSKRVGRSELALTRYLGIRSNMYGRRREYHLASRDARDALRGESTDLDLFDEVRTQIDYETWAALEPTTTARPDPLIAATSTAGNARSVLLRDWWERGVRIIEGAEPMGSFGMTWYAAPDDLAPDDPRAWRIANPSLAEGRMPESVIRESLATYQGQPAHFRMERLNLWSDAVDEWLPAGTWLATVGPEPARDGARVVLAVEVVPSWRRATVTVTVAGAETSWTAVAAEVVPLDPMTPTIGPPDVLDALTAAVRAWRPSAVAYSGSAAAGPYIDQWAHEHENVATIPLGMRELMAASELFRGELVGGRLTHADQPTLARQARIVRPSRAIEGGGWYLSVRESSGDVDAIRAAAWSSWAAIAPPDADVPVQVFL